MNKLAFRLANKEDLLQILCMIADDPLGNKRERFEIPLPDYYNKAFEKIKENSDHELTVVLMDNEIVGTFQLTFLQYLTYKGGLRCQIEAVRVKSELRGTGIGKKMIEYILDRSRKKGCHMVQLTTDATRPDALKFYKAMGFKPSHIGLKFHL